MWKKTFNSIKHEIKEILDEVRYNEYSWPDYIFSGGRKIIGLNGPLLKDWANWNCAPIYDYYGITRDFESPDKDPLPFMSVWMNPTTQQNANQEQSSTDYKLNVAVDDTDDMTYDF